MLHDLMGRLGNERDHLAADSGVGSVSVPPPGPVRRDVAWASRPARRFPDLPDADAWAGLTRREEQVLRLVAEGLTNAQIGERLFVTEATVKSHVKSMMRKLGVATRSEAGAAYYHGTDRAFVLQAMDRPRGQKSHSF
ncbi:helix-turn-helix transcriptional regulator [Candidatus Frankia alpina]|nr:helix-turn-helix transcriptional regulator [Candidatus Frankia alpina]